VGEVLRHAAIFRTLGEEDRERLIKEGVLRSYTKGKEVRPLEGDEPTVCVLTRGGVRIYLLSPEGRELTLLFRRRVAHVFVLSPAESPEIVGVTVAETLSAGTAIYAVSVCQLLDALCRVGLAGQLVVALLQLVQDERVIMSELAFCTVRARLAHNLGHLSQSTADLTLRVGREELAGTVGTTASEVTKQLHHLREEGLVGFRDHQSRRIALLDQEALATYGESRRRKTS
jgi:CRP-like cAMP-binding protein